LKDITEKEQRKEDVYLHVESLTILPNVYEESHRINRRNRGKKKRKRKWRRNNHIQLNSINKIDHSDEETEEDENEYYHYRNERLDLLCQAPQEQKKNTFREEINRRELIIFLSSYMNNESSNVKRQIQQWQQQQQIDTIKPFLSQSFFLSSKKIDDNFIDNYSVYNHNEEGNKIMIKTQENKEKNCFKINERKNSDIRSDGIRIQTYIVNTNPEDQGERTRKSIIPVKLCPPSRKDVDLQHDFSMNNMEKMPTYQEEYYSNNSKENDTSQWSLLFCDIVFCLDF